MILIVTSCSDKLQLEEALGLVIDSSVLTCPNNVVLYHCLVDDFFSSCHL